MTDKRAWFECCKTSDVPEEAQWLTPERAWIEGYRAAVRAFNEDFARTLAEELQDAT